MSKPADHFNNRQKVLEFLVREIHGPSFQGKPLTIPGDEIDCSGTLNFQSWDEYSKSFVQAESRQEILKEEPPSKKYGVGVLFPDEEDDSVAESEDHEPDDAVEEAQVGILDDSVESGDALTSSYLEDLSTIQDRGNRKRQSDDDDEGIRLSNHPRPRSLGISFVATTINSVDLRIRVSAGRYEKKEGITINSGKGRAVRDWWLRIPISMSVDLSLDQFEQPNRYTFNSEQFESSGVGALDLEFEMVVRRPPVATGLPEDARLITVCLVNRTKHRHGYGPRDQSCLFQSYFSVEISQNGVGGIVRYPEMRYQNLDNEENSIDLLYRKRQTYATGHGCAADWSNPENGKVREVRADVLPAVETASTTPDVYRDHRQTDKIDVPMAPLAGLVPGDDGMRALIEVVDRYELWINQQKYDLEGLDSRFDKAGKDHMNQCTLALERMRSGLRLLKSNECARRAFQFANHAVLLQQVAGSNSLREPEWDPEECRIIIPQNHPGDPDTNDLPNNRGNWRPFQIAFLLMALESTFDGTHPDRELVELIWFPTGGGKTEAYLGLTAFSTFARRLKDKDDVGTNVIMRYTLRLLTAQQFQRAAGLLVAMEYLRQQNAQYLGTAEFAIGIWVGGETTSNSNKSATGNRKALIRRQFGTEYNFVLLKCPWCGCRMGPFLPNFRGKKGRKGSVPPGVLGLVESNGEVLLSCPDSRCRFGGDNHLPVYVVDDQIYDRRPSLVIGTVDKFAALAWKPSARSVFGLNEDGERTVSPPQLIVQDELHLISGPLGSMVGLYETAVEALATDLRNPGSPIRPKIVGATATTRAYKKQIRALYARDRSCLFPPPGLDESDSFFAHNALGPDGKNLPGRLYVGIHATAFSSDLTVQVRVFAALLAASVLLDKGQARDPWWTLLVFYNSLRELGGALTLFHADIPERIWQICRSNGVSKADQRYMRRVLELTGRLRNVEVPEAIEKLETTTGGKARPVDACLASNIIEVGVDIDRLSLMAVAGQPKTTAQYIQATGRVGRRWWERPGLIITLLSARKPRDRSHYESFRTYHERLYAQVEPSSVTPFTRPALLRALHAVMASILRQRFGQGIATSPQNVSDEMLVELRSILNTRVSKVDGVQQADLERRLNRLLIEWNSWDPVHWEASAKADQPSLLRRAGSYYPQLWLSQSWSTPSSMRNVDAECRPEITTLYLEQNQTEAEADIAGETESTN